MKRGAAAGALSFAVGPATFFVPRSGGFDVGHYFFSGWARGTACHGGLRADLVVLLRTPDGGSFRPVCGCRASGAATLLPSTSSNGPCSAGPFHFSAAHGRLRRLARSATSREILLPDGTKTCINNCLWHAPGRNRRRGAPVWRVRLQRASGAALKGHLREGVFEQSCIVHPYREWRSYEAQNGHD